ncbi:MAG: cytochrome c [Chthonomonadales bacterium]
MSPEKRVNGFVVCGVVMAGALMALTGCNKGGDAASSGSTPSSGTPVASGDALFKNNGCGKCHGLNGGGGKAPDLSHAGAEAAHDADWIGAHIKDPKTHNPQSRMPAFGGKMSDGDIKTLATYLASLK